MDTKLFAYARYLLLSLLLGSTITASAATRKVLFIGNSYTYVNNMPLMLQNIAAAFGDTLIYDESDPGGYTFALHSAYPPTVSKIFAQPWDVVVLQEQSQMPAFPPSQVATDVYPYATRLDSMIKANDSCTQTMFFMTWGHANGDPMNCPSYPVICTYAGMQQRLRESYMQMALDNHAVVSPVGMAWKKVMDSIPSIWLFSGDSSHAAVPGTYLEACVMYASIFHKPSTGCSYLAGLSSSVAGTLQGVADRTVFDSLTVWQQHGHYPYAGFSWSATGSVVSFSSHSPVISDHEWYFGDGGYDTSVAPAHTYLSGGDKVVTHTVSTSCFTETIVDTIHIATTGLADPAGYNAQLSIRHYPNGGVVFELPAASDMELFDIGGRSIGRYRATTTVARSLAPGLYLYRVQPLSGGAPEKGKFVIY